MLVWTAAVGSVLSLALIYSFNKYNATQRLQQKKAKKLAKQNVLINNLLLPHVDKQTAEEILNSTALQITANITQTKKWTCEAVMAAFIRQAIECHKKTNCLTEIMFSEALEAARQMDLDFKASGKIIGPLHGVPISLKDCVHFRGTDATLGIFKYIDDVSLTNSRIVNHLLAAGCIPFVKTNVPQTMLSFECANPLFGTTTNPYNSAYVPGGSSGGEAALIAGHGSVLGLGSDIGGSLRIPAHFCGIASLKPTVGRLSMQNWRGFMYGQESVKAVPGPMARSVDDLAIFMKVTVGRTDDVKVIPLPFNEESYPFLKNPKAKTRKLTVGYCLSDGFTESMPACKRAVLETVEMLKKAGHEVLEFRLPPIQEMVWAFYGMLSADGGKAVLAALEGNPIEPFLLPVVRNMKAPAAVRTAVSSVLHFLGHSKLAGIVTNLSAKTISDVWKIHHARSEFQQDFYEYWKNSIEDMDCLLYPGFATPALPHLSTGQITFTASYSMLWNVLDYPVGTLPITNVNAELDALDTTEQVEYMDRLVRGCYDSHKMAGLPVGIQIVGLPFQEEKVLYCMKIIEDLNVRERNPEFIRL